MGSIPSSPPNIKKFAVVLIYHRYFLDKLATKILSDGQPSD
jgi:hypothetical protein